MENTIVQFIVENILLFLPLGAIGVIATLLLLFLPKKEHMHRYEEVQADVITLGKLRWNVFVLVYLFIWILMIIIGLFSSFITPTIVGGIIASIPLIVLMTLEHKPMNSKVSKRYAHRR